MCRRPLLFCNLLPALLAGAVLSGAWAQPASVLGVECAKISALGIDRQANLRAGLIQIGCGVDQISPSTAAPVKGRARAIAAPGADLNLITGPEPFPHVTQSESMVWGNGSAIVVNYNDSNTAPSNFSGTSVSTDGGMTFTRLLPAPLATGHGINYGDPVVVFNAALNTWFGGDLADGCGRQGIGMWSSPDALTWTVAPCAHSGASDDRESMWVDNNASSPFYGRMYISWNDFAVGGRLFVTSSDDGMTWSDPVGVSPLGPFVRNVQLAGSYEDGTVFIAGMNEGGGGLNNRTNLMFRSVDGGATWTEIVMGVPFAPPGELGCGYFARILPIWRHMGWGQAGVGPGGVVHYAYAGRGANSGDEGDIYYTQSRDNGDTWSDPIILNTDQAAGGNFEQWMPSLSVTPSGTVRVSWYDRRDTDDGLDYEIFAIESDDNGATWGTDFPVSTTLIAQPAQPDPYIQACYAGDYNYVTSFNETSFITWTDGRNPINGVNQQDVYFAQLP